MSSPGLSLLGFMEKVAAIEHLRQMCICPDASDGALGAQWREAAGRLQAKLVRAGEPTITGLPPEASAYIDQLRERYPEDLSGKEVKVVEIDPLLSYQFTIIPGRCEKHLGSLSNPPTAEEVLKACLPMEAPVEEVEEIDPASGNDGQSSIMLRAKTLNLQVFDAGNLAVELANGKSHNYLGLRYGVTSHFVHVVRYQGRCYLHNGFHRAYGLRKAGVDRMPCIFRDVSSAAEVGIKKGLTFGIDVLGGLNPPTMAHFTMDRAHPVQIRGRTRVLHVSWAVYTLADD